MVAIFESSVFTAAASPLTSTISCVWPTCILKSKCATVPAFTDTPLFDTVLKPEASTVILYVPTGNSFKLYEPLWLVAVVSVKFVLGLLTVTFALAIAAPVGSVTTPANWPFCTWALDHETNNRNTDSNRTTKPNVRNAITKTS